MNFKSMWVVLLLLVTGSAVSQDTSTDKGKLSYAVGYQIGTDPRFRDLDLDVETVMNAIRDGLAERDPTVPEEEMVAILQTMAEEIRAEQIEKFNSLADENAQKSETFLTSNRNKDSIVVLPSGVQYRVIESGTGARPTMDSEVTVHYRSMTMDGREFDSSFIRGEPVTFTVNRVIKGWQEVLPLMKAGARWEVFVPSDLAFGRRGQPPVGPNEVVIYNLNLVEIKS